MNGVDANGRAVPFFHGDGVSRFHALLAFGERADRRSAALTRVRQPGPLAQKSTPGEKKARPRQS
jgi:hypothetical protein